MKRFLYIILIVAMVLTSMTSCGTATNTATTDTALATTDTALAATDTALAATAESSTVPAEPVRELVRFKILQAGSDQTEVLADEVAQIIKEKFNVEFEVIPYTEAAYEKALLMLAARDWGDTTIVNTGIDDVTLKYIAADALVNLDDYRDKLSNFYGYEKDLIPYWRMLAKEDEGLYVWQAGPDMNQMTSPPLDVLTRVDVLEALGWPELDTTDQYIKFLTDGLKKFPETLGNKTIGLANFWGREGSSAFIPYLPRSSGMQNPYNTTALVDIEKQSYVPFISHPYGKESLKYYNTLTRLGLMDAEAWTDSFPEMQKKIESGVCICANFASWMVTGANKILADAGHPEIAYIMTPIRLSIAKQEGKNNRYELYNGIRPDDTRGILKGSKNIDRLIEVINFMSSYEMTIRVGWGVEGRDYTIADGMRVPSKEIIDALTAGDPDKLLKSRGIGIPWTNTFPTRSASFEKGQANTVGASAEYLKLSATEVQMKAYKAYGGDGPMSLFKENKNFKWVPFDMTNYLAAVNLDKSTEEAKAEEKLKAYLDKQIAKIVNAETEEQFEAFYNDALQETDRLGLAKIISVYNKQYQEMDGKFRALAEKYK